MSGPPPKPRDQRARRNKDEGTTSTSVALPSDTPPVPRWAGPTVELEVAGMGVEVPKPPTRLLKQSVEAWAMFWLAPESSMLRPHHLPALRRLILLYDEEERIRRRVAKSRVVALEVPLGLDGPLQDGEFAVDHEVRGVRLPGHLGIGSQGQVVQSPDFQALMKVRERIQALEDRFAATPLAEFRVGWQRAAMVNEEARAREAQELAKAAAELARSHQQLRAGAG